MNGLWSLVLDFNGKQSGATIVITDGKILGGDSGMTYVGTIQAGGDGTFSGTINAEQYLEHADAFFPGVKSLDVHIAGKHSDGNLDGTATISLAANQKIKLSGSKKADL